MALLLLAVLRAAMEHLGNAPVPVFITSLVVGSFMVVGVYRNELLSDHYADWASHGAWSVSVRSNDPLWYGAWAEYFMRKGTPQGLSAALEKVDEAGERTLPYLMLQKARILKRMGEPEKALEGYRAYLSRIREQPDGILLEMAEVLVDLKRFEETETLLRQYGGSGGRAGFIRGMLAERKNDLDQALTLYKASLSRDPKDPQLLMAVGRIYSLQGNHDKAVAYLELAMTRSDDIELITLLVRCYLRENRCQYASGLVNRHMAAAATNDERLQRLETLSQEVETTCFSAEPNRPDGSARLWTPTTPPEPQEDKPGPTQGDTP